jgi:hypothetical protein
VEEQDRPNCLRSRPQLVKHDLQRNRTKIAVNSCSASVNVLVGDRAGDWLHDRM